MAVNRYSFQHWAPPKAKERPRSGKGRQLYTPKATLDAEKALALDYQGPVFEGPVAGRLEFHPDYTWVELWEWDGPESPLRGDVDNYEKLVWDALEGVAYANDHQVMFSESGKYAS